MEKSNSLNISTEAIFWDGVQQLSGMLIIKEEVLVFQFDDFKHSHLNLEIRLNDIKIVKPFLLFKVSRKGLKVVSTNDKIDLFILEDSKGFSDILNRKLR